MLVALYLIEGVAAASQLILTTIVSERLGLRLRRAAFQSALNQEVLSLPRGCMQYPLPLACMQASCSCTCTSIHVLRKRACVYADASCYVGLPFACRARRVRVRVDECALMPYKRAGAVSGEMPASGRDRHHPPPRAARAGRRHRASVPGGTRNYPGFGGGRLPLGAELEAVAGGAGHFAGGGTADAGAVDGGAELFAARGGCVGGGERERAGDVFFHPTCAFVRQGVCRKGSLWLAGALCVQAGAAYGAGEWCGGGRGGFGAQVVSGAEHLLRGLFGASQRYLGGYPRVLHLDRAPSGHGADDSASCDRRHEVLFLTLFVVFVASPSFVVFLPVPRAFALSLSASMSS